MAIFKGAGVAIVTPMLTSCDCDANEGKFGSEL